MTFQHLELDQRDVERIVKILELSTSDVDGEALAAIRKSRQILRKYGCNYEALIEAVRVGARRDVEIRVSHLQAMLEEQSCELTMLRKQTEKPKSQLTEETIFTGSLIVTGSIFKLRTFLLNRLPLQKHERAILENISNIVPKSKEEYLILICARRHKVSFHAS